MHCFSAPPVFISQPASNALIVGTKQQLHCSCSGHPLPTIQWRKNNALLNDANINVSRTAVDEGSLVVAHSSLHFSPVTAHSIGDYSCTCSNSLARNITISSSIGLVSVLCKFSKERKTKRKIRGCLCYYTHIT